MLYHWAVCPDPFILFFFLRDSLTKLPSLLSNLWSSYHSFPIVGIIGVRSGPLFLHISNEKSAVIQIIFPIVKYHFFLITLRIVCLTFHNFDFRYVLSDFFAFILFVYWICRFVGGCLLNFLKPHWEKFQPLFVWILFKLTFFLLFWDFCGTSWIFSCNPA